MNIWIALGVMVIFWAGFAFGYYICKKDLL